MSKGNPEPMRLSAHKRGILHRAHDQIVIGYIGLLGATIVAALLLNFRDDLVALFGCALGGLMHSLIWPSDE